MYFCLAWQQVVLLYTSRLTRFAHKLTQRKVSAHARKCEIFLPIASNNICGTRATFYILFSWPHSDLNSHFKKLSTSNTSLTLKELHEPKHALSTLSHKLQSSSKYNSAIVAQLKSYEKSKEKLQKCGEREKSCWMQPMAEVIWVGFKLWTYRLRYTVADLHMASNCSYLFSVILWLQTKVVNWLF